MLGIRSYSAMKLGWNCILPSENWSGLRESENSKIWDKESDASRYIKSDEMEGNLNITKY